MIETISINEREIDLCLNAESQTLLEERRPWLFINKQLSALKKKYYLESEGFLFFDEGKAISIAAQIVQWIHTDIHHGRHYIFLPFDNVVYVATIRVQEDYILVEKEDLLSFEDSIQLIRDYPLECQVAELGKLSHAFTQHNIALKDLYINLDPGGNNPFLLRRGYNLVELPVLTIVPLLGASLIFMLSSTIAVKETETPVIKPKSTVQVGTDLEAINALLSAFAVLLAYNLENIQIKKSSNSYNTIASGQYLQAFSLARLNEIARQLHGRVTIQKNNWTLNSSLFNPPAVETEELASLPAIFEQYRQFAIRNKIRFSITGISQQQDAARGVIELAIDYPNHSTLQQTVRQLKQTRLHGHIQKVDIHTQKNAAWGRLTITVEITGT